MFKTKFIEAVKRSAGMNQYARNDGWLMRSKIFWTRHLFTSGSGQLFTVARQLLCTSPFPFKDLIIIIIYLLSTRGVPCRLYFSRNLLKINHTYIHTVLSRLLLNSIIIRWVRYHSCFLSGLFHIRRKPVHGYRLLLW